MRTKFLMRTLMATMLLLCLSATSQAASRRYWVDVGRDSGGGGYTRIAALRVRAIQFLLRSRGYKATTDGVYGAQTESLVKRFQRSKALRASGRVNGPTWEALIVPVKDGNRGDAVRALQSLLRELNLRPQDQNEADDRKVALSGIFGPQTQSAVKKFQADNELKVDGVAGAYTWCLLTQGALDKAAYDATSAGGQG